MTTSTQDKTFLADFEKKVKKTIKDHGLISPQDKLLVAVSGGKDSTTILHLLNKFGYKVEAMILDLMIGDWSKQHLDNVEKFCAEEKIKLHVIDLRKEFGCSMCFMKAGIQSKIKLNNCMICGIIKRWLMNRKARELGATKLITGHNLDDGAETVLMNLFKGNMGMLVGMGPKTGVVKDKKFVPRIKPLYFCLNSEVGRYSKIKKFPVVYDPCPCLVDSFRRRMREQLTLMEKKNPKIKRNIVKTFLEIMPALEKKHKSKNETVKYCVACGEPSRGEICKMCDLLRVWKGK